MRKEEGHGVELTYYDFGRTPFYALQSEPRVSYCLYVPEDYDEGSDKAYGLVVPVHGTERGASEYRDAFIPFAEENDCIVLAPLFPVGLGGADDLDNYKLIEYGGIRFDLALLDMVAEIAAKYRLTTTRMMLHGFSGGGHFAHRFFYLHPKALRAVSIGAPGVVTLLDRTLPWWTGVKDLESRFGTGLDLSAMRRVPVQMIIGGEDKATWEITIQKSSFWWMEGANEAGETRLERMEKLKETFETSGIQVRHDVVPGVEHNGDKVLPAVMSFMSDVLRVER